MFQKFVNYLVKKSDAYKQLEERIDLLEKELHNWAWGDIKPIELITEEYIGEDDEEAV